MMATTASATEAPALVADGYLARGVTDASSSTSPYHYFVGAWPSIGVRLAPMGQFYPRGATAEVHLR